MDYIKVKKNGVTITVLRWSKDVIVTNAKGEKLMIQTFSDHIKAVAVAKAL